MAGIVSDENIAKNGISSVLSSPDSVDVLIHTDSNETSTTDLPSSSGSRPMSSSTTRSSVTSSSEITWDFSTTPVNSSESPVSSEKGSRFIVKRLQSSELQQISTNSSSTNSSSSRVDRTPSQSPKSVKFTVEKESPVKSQTKKSPKVKSPKETTSPKEKSPKNGGLTKSTTTDEIPKLLGYKPKELFSPISQDSFPHKEEIELSTLRNDKREEETSDEEIIFGKPDQSKAPLLSRKNVTRLSDSETDLLNRAQAVTSLDVRGPGGIVTTMSVAELPTTPVSTTSPSEGTSTANTDQRCENCLVKSTIAYVTLVIGVFIGGAMLYGAFYWYGHFETNNLANNTDSDIETALTAGILNLGTKMNLVSAPEDEPLTTELPITTDESAFSTIQETDTPITITNSPDNVITETTTNAASTHLPNTATFN